MSRDLERNGAERRLQEPGAPAGAARHPVDDGIPMADGEADVVVALDVLKHTNAIHHAFDELCRVARGHIVIALPNQFEIRDRWATIRGRNRSGKYGLPRDPHG